VRIGVDLGGTKIEAIAIDDDGCVLWRRRIATPAGDYAGILEAVGDSAEDLAMSAYVGTFALVRNGADADHALAARARWITSGANGAGVLEAVTTWLTGAAPAPTGRPH